MAHTGLRTIVWFRGKDLRLSDHAPLRDAAAAGEVVPLFVLDPYFFAPTRAQRLPRRMQFLLESIAELSTALEERGSRLLLVPGKSVEVVPRLVQALGADRVLAHRWVEPIGRERDQRIAAALGGRFVLYEGETLVPPGSLRTSAGSPFSVYGAFARTFFREAQVGAPLPAPARLPPVPPLPPVGEVGLPALEELGLARRDALAGGERAGRARLDGFLRERLPAYARDRDRMDLVGTSRISADLKFGTLSVREVWTRARAAPDGRGGETKFLSELLWREFSYGVLWARPWLLERPFREGFATFPYRDDDAAFDAWAAGRTGYPVVDAAARQLLAEGFVHNRARMISASFLTKHLLVDYRRGEAHYLAHLTDGDFANNNFGWQWCAGSGVDAQPYFRVFNPTTQGQRLDPTGAYVRRWVPELARLPTEHLHAPAAAPARVLAEAGVRLGADYPDPIVEHGRARARFLALAAAHLKGA